MIGLPPRVYCSLQFFFIQMMSDEWVPNKNPTCAHDNLLELITDHSPFDREKGEKAVTPLKGP